MDVIIGGGITGLSYACFRSGVECILIEKTDSIGGYCKTTVRNGFVWDYSGHFFHFQDEDIKKIATKGIEEDDLNRVEKVTHILYKDKFIDFPFQKNIHQLDKEDFIDCLTGLFETSGDCEYTTFKGMINAKFGSGIANRFLIPYNSKLYACDLDKLDKDAMGRFFPYADKEEIVRNFKNRQNESYNGSFIYPRNGAFEHVKSIASQIEDCSIMLDNEVVSIDPDNKIVQTSEGKEIKYDNLISTIPFPKLLSLAGIGFDEEKYSWNKVLVFNLGFDRKGPNRQDHWIYFPDGAYCFYRVGFYNNILGKEETSLYVEIAFDKDEIIKPEEWLGRVLNHLVKSRCIDTNQVLVDFEFVIMDPAYVHISNASIRDVAERKRLLKKYNIYSIGRYGSWTYCSIEDNIKEAKALATELNAIEDK